MDFMSPMTFLRRDIKKNVAGSINFTDTLFHFRAVVKHVGKTEDSFITFFFAINI